MQRSVTDRLVMGLGVAMAVMPARRVIAGAWHAGIGQRITRRPPDQEAEQDES
jgi:hypothetical protein